jgi:hypothetical protein
VQKALRVDRLVGRRGLSREGEERELERHLHERVRARPVPDDRALTQVLGVGHDEIRATEQGVHVAPRGVHGVSQRLGRVVGKESRAQLVRSASLGRRVALVLDEQLREPHRGAPVEARVLHAEAGEAVRGDDELDGLVEPAGAPVAVQEQPGGFLRARARRRAVVQYEDEDRPLDGVEELAADEVALPDVRPRAASSSGEDARRRPCGRRIVDDPTERALERRHRRRASASSSTSSAKKRPACSTTTWRLPGYVLGSSRTAPGIRVVEKSRSYSRMQRGAPPSRSGSRSSASTSAFTCSAAASSRAARTT